MYKIVEMIKECTILKQPFIYIDLDDEVYANVVAITLMDNRIWFAYEPVHNDDRRLYLKPEHKDTLKRLLLNAKITVE